MADFSNILESRLFVGVRTITLFGLAAVLIVAASPCLVVAQKSDGPTEVIASSWKTGTETVSKTRIRLKLTSKTPRFSKEIQGKNGKRYYLQLDYMPYWRLSLEHWVVSLYEENHQGDGYVIKIDDLLSRTHRPPDKTDIRRHFIGVIYPENDIAKLQSDNTTKWFYPASTVRKINVEGFCVELKVKSFKFSKADSTRTDPLDLSITFRPHCES